MAPEPAQLADEHDDATSVGGRAMKRAKPAHTRDTTVIRRRGKRLSLSKLTDMPLDVIFEIFGHLHPADLLNVARTTKLFHQLLMRRSSVTIWKAALVNVPSLPKCPKGMTELAYTNLLFSNHCHYCGKSGCNAIEWELLARVCKACREDKELFFSLREIGRVKDYETMLKYLPSMTKGKDVFVRVDDILLLQEKLENIKEKEEKDADAIERDIAEMMLVQLVKLDIQRCKIAEAKVWDAERGQDREQELDQLREQRRDAVWQRLTELELGEERELMDHYDRDTLEHMEGMKEPTPLTERNWDKVKDRIIAHVQRCRQTRLREQRFKPYQEALEPLLPHLDAFVSSRPPDDIYPTALDFFMSPQIRPIVEGIVQSGIDTLDVEHFKELIPEVCRAHTDMVTDRVLELLPPWLRRSKENSRNPLESALVWFKCSHSTPVTHWNACRQTAVAFPRIIGHVHVRKNMDEHLDPKSSDDDLMNAICANWTLRLNSAMFSEEELTSNIAFDLHLSFLAAQLVELCGLNPETAQYSDMDRLDVRIACVPCKNVMTWRKAVTHVLKCRHSKGRSWVLLNDEDTQRVKKVEGKHKPKTTTGRFHCYYCRRFGGRWEFGFKGLKELKVHLAGKHGIVKFRPKLMVDYYFPVGEPTCDGERPHPVGRKELDFKFSTPALVAEGW